MSLALKSARMAGARQGMPGMGDPGLFGGLFNIGKSIAGAVIPGFSTAEKLVSRGAKALGIGSRRAPTPPPRPVAPAYDPAQPQRPVPGIRGFVQRALPGGRSGYQEPAVVGAIDGMPPKGYHLNESDYWLKDGTFVPARSRWVKNRRRNPLNPRAASKAISRIEQLKRATKRFGRITIRKKCCD